MPRKSIPNYSKYIKTAEDKKRAREKRHGYLDPVNLVATTPMYNLDYYYKDRMDRARELCAANEVLSDNIRRKMVYAYQAHTGKQNIIIVDYTNKWRTMETEWKAEVMAFGSDKDKKWLDNKFKEVVAEVVESHVITSRWRRRMEDD